MGNTRHHLTLAALIWAVAAASSFATAHPGKPAKRDDGWTLALTPHLTGKGGWTTCYAFAKTLQGRFTQSGTECHLVIYNWTDQFHYSNRHAFVVYRDAEGRYWGMDNLSAKPRWLPGTTPMEWASFWAGASTVLRVTDATDHRLAGKTADQTLLAGAPSPTLVADNRPPAMHRRGAKATRPV